MTEDNWLIESERIEAARPDPDWTAGGRVHNWKNHVGHRTQAIWASLTEEQRLAIAEDAADGATAEEWE